MDLKLRFHARYCFETITEKNIDKVRNIEDIKEILKYLLKTTNYKNIVLEVEIKTGIPVLKMSAFDIKSNLEIVLKEIKSLRDLSVGLGCISTKIYSIIGPR